MNQSLHSYLNTVSRAGTLESKGHFTVDIHNKRMKIRQNQLLSPTHYLLCCVRAGVTAGADLVDIRLDYNKTTVLLKNIKQIEARELLEGIHRRDSGGPTEQLLGAALQGGLAIGADLVVVNIPGAEIVLTSDAMDVKPIPTAGNDCWIQFRFNKLGYLAGRNRCVRESQAVYSRCAFCPIPVMLDKLSVIDHNGWETLFNWQRCEEQYGVDPDFVWIEAHMADDGEGFYTGSTRRRSRIEYLGGERFLNSAWRPKRETSFLKLVPRSNGNRHHVQSLIRLGSHLGGHSYLYLVKQGVVLEAIQEDLGAPGIGAVIRADQLETDFSLFKPVMNELYNRKVKALQAQVVALVAQLGLERKNLVLEPRHSAPEIMLKSTVVGSGGAVFGSIVGAWGAVLFGGAFFLTAGLLCLIGENDRVLVEREQGIRWELDAYVNLVRPPRLDGKVRL